MTERDASPPLCLDDASYVLGALLPSERDAFEEHLASCPTCQASVNRLAGLPGLLALASAADVTGERIQPSQPDVGRTDLPETLLPALMSVAAREGRRRKWLWVGSVAAAAACLVALVVTLVLRPAGPGSTQQVLPAPIAMRQVVASPMNVSLQLVDKQWGTSIIVNCHYQLPVGSSTPDTAAIPSAKADLETYQLVVYDKAGRMQQVGHWSAAAGGGSTVWTSTSLRLSQIVRVDVQWPNGKTLLTAVPSHA